MAGEDVGLIGETPDHYIPESAQDEGTDEIAAYLTSAAH